MDTLKEVQDFINAIMGTWKEGDFNKNDLLEGIKVEYEHTQQGNPYGRIIAEKIARDHLTENPNYYKILKKVGL